MLTQLTAKFLRQKPISLIYYFYRNSTDGSIKQAGGKFAEMQTAREGEYFHKKNEEYLQYIKDELKKGRSIEDVIEDTRKELRERERCKEKKMRQKVDETCEDN